LMSGYNNLWLDSKVEVSLMSVVSEGPLAPSSRVA